jgi:RimJ/RimL family protein N-acetyltransferase
MKITGHERRATAHHSAGPPFTKTLDSTISALTRIELSVRERNGRVVSLYERFEFVREGLQRNAVRVDGQYENLICMALLLEKQI